MAKNKKPKDGRIKNVTKGGPKKYKLKKRSKYMFKSPNLKTLLKRAQGVVRFCQLSDFDIDVFGNVRCNVDFTSNLIDENCHLLSSSGAINELVRDKERSEVTFSVNLGDEVYETTKTLFDLRNLFFVDLKVKSEDGEELDQIEKAKLEKLQYFLVKNGFFYDDEHGVEKHSQWFFRSIAQDRGVKGIFIDGDPIPMLQSLGQDPRAYSTFDAQNGIYILDVSQYVKRVGLNLSSSLEISDDEKEVGILFGSRVIDHDLGYLLVPDVDAGESHDTHMTGLMMNTDCSALIDSEDYYFLMDEASKVPKKYKFSDSPRYRVAGDGQFYVGPRPSKMIEEVMGCKVPAGIFRSLSALKGLGILNMPTQNAFSGVDFIFPKSCVKANVGKIVKTIKNRGLRLCTYAKEKSWNGEICYQFVNCSRLNFKDIVAMSQPRFDELFEALSDKKKISRIAAAKIVDDEGVEPEGEGFETKLKTFLTYAPDSYVDIWMQRKAADVIIKQFEKYLGGSVPAISQFRYGCEDPFAILDTIADYKNAEKDPKGRLIIPKDRGIPSGHVISPIIQRKPGNRELVHYDFKVGEEAAFGRVPAITRSELRIVTFYANERYRNSVRAGIFHHLSIKSVHDMNSEAAGGGDNDGDMYQYILNPEIINSLRPFMKLPIIIDDGCPWRDTSINLDKLKFSFTEKEFSIETYRKMHELSKDYVVMTLKQNKIGYLTNIATKIHDGIRVLGYKYAGTNDDEEKEFYQSEISSLWMNLVYLRYCVGYEIDRPKNGGAYEEALEVELSFVENPPPSIAYYSKLLGKYIYKVPTWLASHNKRPGGWNTGSVLCKYHDFVKSYIKKINDRVTSLFKETIESMKRADGAYANTLISEMVAAIDLGDDSEIYDALKDLVGPIKERYNTKIGAFFKQKAAMINDGVEEEIAQAKFVACVKNLTEDCQADITAIEELYGPHGEKFSPEQIGLVAYYLTYANLKATKKYGNGETGEFFTSINFPWHVATSQLLAAMRVATGKTTSKVYRTESVGDFTFSAFTDYDLDQVSERIFNNPSIKVCLENKSFVVKLEGISTPIATVSPKEVYLFSGRSSWDLQVSNLEHNGKSVIKLTVSC